MAGPTDPKPDEPADDPPPHRLHIWQIQAVRDVLLVAAVGALLWLGHAMRAVTVPLLVALLLAYLFEPLVARLSRHRKVSRPMAVGGLLGTVGLVVVVVLAIVIPAVVRQTSDLVTAYQDGQFRTTALQLSGYLPETWRKQADSLIEYLPQGPQPSDEPINGAGEPAPLDAAPPSGLSQPPGGRPTQAASTSPDEDDRIRAIVREEIERAAGFTAADGEGAAEPPRKWFDLATGGARAVGALLGGIIRLGFLAFLIPFYFFFFSASYPAVASFGHSLIPESNRPRTLELLSKMDRVVAGFVRGRIVIALIMGAMLAIGWRICGVPYSIVLGFVVGVFCAVPYLGTVGIPLAVGLLFFNQLGLPAEERTIWLGWWGVILWPTVVFGIVQVIEGYVLTPMIAGKATNLDPVTILVAVLAGGSIMGVYGMLLAIPVAACLKIICTDVLLPKVRAWTRGEAADPLPLDRVD